MSDNGIEVKKIPVSVSGGKSLSQIDKDSQNVIDKNRERFVVNMGNDLEEINNLLDSYIENPSPGTMKSLFNLVHNLRGQGAMFDYPLVTAIGGEFCRYIDGLPDGQEPRLDVIKQFLDMLTLVKSQNIVGEGSPQFQELVNNMRLMVDKFVVK